jgi:hypothetical protein
VTLTERLARLNRRRFLLGAGTVLGAGAGAGAWISQAAGATPAAPLPLGAQPAGLPARQHAWTEYLSRDSDGNPVPPRFSAHSAVGLRAAHSR